MFPFVGFETVTGPLPRPPIDRLKYSQPASQERFERVRNAVQHLPNGDANPEWLEARIGVVTGSRAANCCQLSYNSIRAFLKRNGLDVRTKTFTKDLLKQMMLENRVCSRSEVDDLLTPFTGNKFTRWGNDHEDDCEMRFQEEILGTWGRRLPEHRSEEYIANDVEAVEFHHDGLCLSATHGWAGYSPDGRMEQTFVDGSSECCLLEFKCPYTKRRTFETKNLYGPTQSLEGEWFPITPYYYVQIQHGMNLLFDRGLLWPKTPHGHCKRCGQAVVSSPTHICDDALVEARRAQLYCYFAVWTWPEEEKWHNLHTQRPSIHCLVCGSTEHSTFRCPYKVVGNVEVSRIPFSQTFAEWLTLRCADFWEHEYMPALENSINVQTNTPWLGRTIQDKRVLFDFLEERIKAARIPRPSHFVDWGCGKGTMLQYAVEQGFATGWGIEQDSQMARVPQPPSITVVEGDILDISTLPCREAPAIHFIYDGGLFPLSVAQHICALLKQHAGPGHGLVLITSRYPPNTEGQHLEANDYARILRPVFSKAKTSMLVSEAHGEETMRVHFFYSK